MISIGAQSSMTSGRGLYLDFLLHLSSHVIYIHWDVWCKSLQISKPRGSASWKPWCISVRAKGVLLVHNPINKRHTECLLECCTFLCIYLILPAATNASLSACDWKAGKEQDWASARSNEPPHWTSQNTLSRMRALPEALLCLGLHLGGVAN